MRSIIFLIFFITAANLAASWADDASDKLLTEEDQTFLAESKPEPPPKSEPVQASGKLVDLGISRAVARIDTLEREVADLRRDNRTQDERIRALDRSIDDLKRRF